MKITHYLILLITILAVKLYSQDTIIVFKDYASFTSMTGEHYDKMLGYTNGAIKVNLILQQKGVETKIKCIDIWGFLYNGNLFRTDARTGQVARLISKGKICYYENGIAHLKMIRDKTTNETFSIGYYCYVSKNLETNLVPFPDPNSQVSDANKLLRRFKKDNPEYEYLFKTMNKPYQYYEVRQRISEYEKK
ncbi:MAG: hypothetical protein JNM51_05465 [Bacteroidia bacterium]|nr:hypothetical protein [Bacteroidia bacterium]